MSSEEADVSNGDSRKVIFALLERMHQWYSSIDPSTDRPSKLSISRSSYVDEATGNIVRTYTIQTTLSVSGLEVVSE
jgi:hypothetical protein